MKRRGGFDGVGLCGLAVLATVSVLASLCAPTYAQESLCGAQFVIPKSLEVFENIEEMRWVFLPTRSVTNPIFEITFPSGLFFGPYLDLTGLNMRVTNCIEGKDEKATHYVFDTYGVLRNDPNSITGTLQAGKECVLLIRRNSLEEMYDFRAPRTVLGNVTSDGVFYEGFSIKIYDSKNTLMMVSEDAYDRKLRLRVKNELNDFTMYGIQGQDRSFQGFSDSLDGLRFTFTPAMPDPHYSLPDEGEFWEPPHEDEQKKKGVIGLPDFLHAKFGPDEYVLNFTFRYDIFDGPDGAGNLTLDISGCFDATNRSFVLNGTSAYAFLGEQKFKQQACEIVIRKVPNSQVRIFFPKVSDLSATLEVYHDHKVIRHDHTHSTTPFVPMYGGRNKDILTTGWLNIAVNATPTLPALPGTELEQLIFTAEPRRVGSTSMLRLIVSGLDFADWDPGFQGESVNDFTMTIEGCGDVQNGQVSSACSATGCTMGVVPTWTLTEGTCVFSLRKAAGSNIKMTLPSHSSTILFTIGTEDINGGRGLSAGTSENYAEISWNVYGLHSASITPSNRGGSVSLASLLVQAKTSNAITGAEKPEVWLTVPKSLSIQNTKTYKAAVSGCATGSKVIKVPDEPGCEFTFKVPVQSVAADKVCSFVLQPGGDDPGLLKNPSSSYAPVSLQLATVKNGAVVDSTDPEETSYDPVGGEDPTVVDKTSSGVENITFSLIHGAVVMLGLLALF